MEVRLKTESKFKFNTAQIYFESSPNLFDVERIVFPYEK
jgi:hypothetical protein